MHAKILWQADEQRQRNSHMQKFWLYCQEATGQTWRDWPSFYLWSISELDVFWTLCQRYCQVRWDQEPEHAFVTGVDAHSMHSGSWFDGGKINIAENMVFPTDCSREIAILSFYEERAPEQITQMDLERYVTNLASHLVNNGLECGDVVAGVVGHSWHAIVAMLATIRCGGIWSSCSPDFGKEGILERLSQVGPKFIFFQNGYSYAGRRYETVKTMLDVLQGLASEIVPISITLDESPDSDVSFARDFMELVTETPKQISPYVTVEAQHPLFIMFSSGTTGKPKCIVHGSASTLVQHKKELMLHCDIKASEKIFYFTTCGWMMWNWQVSALSLGATVVTYDGSPTYPNFNRLWSIVAEQRIETFGTSPKFLTACQDKQINPSHNDLSHLRTILSTGAPLSPQNFQWVYEDVKADVHLASISGGTDIIGCFMLGNPLLPVRDGEIQAPGLGMAIESWDEDGHHQVARKGELVCTKPFVSMPLGFLNDPDHSIYDQSYFHHFKVSPSVWRHGDFIEITGEGGIIVYGRSDATLNPQGVRIGTAEIYRQIEKLSPVEDSLVAGWQVEGDVRIILFVQLTAESVLTDDLIKLFKQHIRATLTPRHVPYAVYAVDGIPYTRSGKKIEILVTKILNHEEIDNMSAVLNPQVCDQYRVIADHLSI